MAVQLLRTKRKAGFTLVEVMTAMAICVFGLLTLMALLPVGFKAVQDASEVTTQADIMRRLTADFRSAGFTNITNSASNRFYDVDGFEVQSNNPGRYYTVNWTVSGTNRLPADGVNPMTNYDYLELRKTVYINFIIRTGRTNTLATTLSSMASY